MPKPPTEAEKETITTHELLERSARAALELQREDGSFPPGRNGVYDEPETPVRTTSHWLTTLSKVYEITGDEVFAEAANDAADYLLSDEARPYGYTFHSRNAEGKDKCDGLIGQAAPMRGLAWAGPTLERPELLEEAMSVFSAHPFDDQIGLWERVEIDGTLLSFDRTLNHQITFASASANLTEEYQGAETRIRQFLNRLATNIRTHSDGLIKHYARPAPLETFVTVLQTPRHWRLFLNELVVHYYSMSEARRKKETGYHPINIYGLAKLKHSFPDHPVWDHQFVDRMINFVDSKEYREVINSIDVQCGSMAPGIQTAYALLTFDNRKSSIIADWISQDIETRFDSDRDLFIMNALDCNFQAASVYHAVNLPNIKVDFIHNRP